VIVTVVPTGPEVGEKEMIVGGAAAVTVKLWELVAVPSGVVTLIGPVVAPEGTVVVTLVFEFAVNVADTPLNVTLVAAMRSVPVIVTDVPTGPLVGENEEIVGAAARTRVRSPSSRQRPRRRSRLGCGSPCSDET
jgi:hypothetical protein